MLHMLVPVAALLAQNSAAKTEVQPDLRYPMLRVLRSPRIVRRRGLRMVAPVHNS
jgi:hypothetical protein